jgi:RNA-directed DNA polymerase
MAADLRSLLEGMNFPSKPSDYFSARHLEDLFRTKIARSQATGKDGVRTGHFERDLAHHLDILARKISNGSYKFTPYKERLLLRGADREPRQISIPTVRDRLALRALCEALHKYVPHCRGSSPHSLVKRVSIAIATIPQDHSFVRLDVKNFFPSILHDRLHKELVAQELDPIVRRLCMKAVTTPTGSSAKPNFRGIPQGLSVSSALSAIYMLRFDSVQAQRSLHYFRYVDDILLISPTDSAASELQRISASLNRRGLKVHKLGTSGKTEIRAVEDGIDFLGYHIRSGKVSIRESSYVRMFRNILKVVTDYRYRRNVERTMFRLNLKVTGCIVDRKRRGWMMFFSQTDDLSQLRFLDEFLRKQIRRVGFPADRIPDVKTFVKSRHEIRYNLINTSYIPNFDEYKLGQKSEVVAILTGQSLDVVMGMDVQSIEDQFSRLLSKEIQDLEQDVGNPS